MATTCYACFDGDNDIRFYRLMQAWHVNEKFDFTFINAHDLTQSRDSSTEETIKRSLKTRLKASDVLVVLVGENTRSLYKFVRWEIEVAIELGLSIVVVNLDKKRSMNSDLCPPILRNELAIHVPFGHKIIDFAIKKWPSSATRHRAAGKNGPYYYPDSVYNDLGL